MKKIIIVDSGGKRGLANQLWNAATLYAFSLEHNSSFENWAIFKHAKYFDFKTTSPLIKIIFFDDLFHLGDNRIKLYRYLTKLWKVFYGKMIVDSGELPSSPDSLTPFLNAFNKVYTFGWLFRDANLIERQRSKIINFFRPSSSIEKEINQRFSVLRKKYQHIVGVHIRRTDYRRYNEGEYFFSDQEVITILKDYLKWSKFSPEKILFYIVSDEAINPKTFSELNAVVNQNSDVDDLFSLAKTDLIIGSNSTFNAFSSFIGRVQLVVFKKHKIDWTEENKIKPTMSYKKCSLIHL